MKVKQTAVAFLISLSAVAVADETRVLELDARPEGITNGPGSALFVSQILSGAVVAFEANSGKSLGEVVPEQNERQAWGLWYYKGAIFVCGGGEVFGGGKSEVYVYDAKSGASLAKCIPESINDFGFGSFINDVAVVDGKAYITDSFSNKLMVLDADKAIDGECVVSSLNLPEAFIPQNQDDFGANGVAPFADGLLVSDEVDGTVWFLNLQEETSQQIIADSSAPGADGLVICDEEKLYVTLNFDPQQIDVYSLAGGNGGMVVVATKLDAIKSDLFDTPATAAIYKNYIYATNARFYNPDTPDIGDEPEEGENAIGILVRPDLRCLGGPF